MFNMQTLKQSRFSFTFVHLVDSQIVLITHHPGLWRIPLGVIWSVSLNRISTTFSVGDSGPKQSCVLPSQVQINACMVYNVHTSVYNVPSVRSHIYVFSCPDFGTLLLLLFSWSIHTRPAPTRCTVITLKCHRFLFFVCPPLSPARL